jgi:nucleoid-associated protein YgaU/DNA-binding SARP family transcriptional activator
MRLIGLAGVLGILMVLIGVPLILLAVGANPIPSSLPTWDGVRIALTSPDDGTAIMIVFRIAAWATWLFLALSVTLEVIARLRGVSAPQMPGMSPLQNVARGLVGAAVLLIAVLPVAAQASPAGAATSYVPVSATAAIAPAVAPQVASLQVAKPALATIAHTVRSGETLWSIAEYYLGDGSRYPEIAGLNYGRAQPGGGELSSSHWIRAGWQLDVPAPARTAVPTQAHDYTVKDGDTLWDIAQSQLGDGSRYPEIVAASRGITQPGGHQLVDPGEVSAGWTLRIPGVAEETAAPGARTPPVVLAPTTHGGAANSTSSSSQPAVPVVVEPSASATQAQPAPVNPGSWTLAAQSEISAPAAAAAQDHLEETNDWPARTGAGVGALLAAGVLTLLAKRRRDQQRRRRPGQVLPMPTGAAAEVEQDLRATADALSVDAVDVALRTLARTCAETGTPLPVVRAARLTADQFDLYLAEPAQLPEPWSGTADSTVWTFDADTADTIDPESVANIPAPYPALVTIGHDLDNGHVFLDLEYIGALGIAGDAERTREVIAAIAIELATSHWADDLQVTIVGAYPELEDALRTGRIRYLPAVGRILDELSARAAEDRAAMVGDDSPDLQHARVNGAAPGAWTPEIVLLAGSITTRQRNQLEALVDELPRVAIAAITSGVSVGEWALDLTAGEDLGVLSPIGLQLRPQRIDAGTYGHILDMVSLTESVDEADDVDATGEPEPTLEQVSHVKPIDEPSNDADDAAEQATTTDVVTCGETISQTALDGTDVDQHAANQEPEVSEQLTDVEELLRPDDLEVDEHEVPKAAEVQNMPRPTPLIRVLGPVGVEHNLGSVEPSKRNRLLEYAAYLALNPGATHKAIDDAIWPARKKEDNLNTRNTATSKLRSWMGKTPAGEDYLPRHQAGSGYAFLPAVRTDWDLWTDLLQDGPLRAPTECLEQALDLVRGRPFDGVHPRHYAWAEPIRQRMISEIVDASYELARRRLMEGHWRASEQAVVIGLTIEPALERLWRMRILAAHESRNGAAEQEAIDRMLAITDELGGDLEAETENLLAGLKDPRREFDQLVVDAL